MSQYRIRHNDSGEYVAVEGYIDLPAAKAQGVIARRRAEFDQANNPEPYAPWGLSVVCVIHDEDAQQVIEQPLDWREFYFEHDPRAEKGQA